MMHDVMNSRRASERMEAVSWGLYKKKKENCCGSYGVGGKVRRLQ